MMKPKSVTQPQRSLIHFPEPRLRFAHEQALADPKDGLLLFGPPNELDGIRYGVIGTQEGIDHLVAWAHKLASPIPADPDVASSVMFPGFEAVFRAQLNPTPRVTLPVDAQILQDAINNADPYQRVYDAVELFEKPMRTWVTDESPKVALWFVVVPELLWKQCRPKSVVPKAERVSSGNALSHKKAMALLDEPDLFEDVNEAAEKHLYENHFHNQLKAKLLGCEAVTQIVRETTIAPQANLNHKGKPKRKLQDEATIAWNLGTAIYYKAGELPWSLADIRDGVCYIGLVFKRTHTNAQDEFEACCGAQMFLHTGEGVVFKGSVGSWASERPGEFHLPREYAADIVKRCVESYKKWHGGTAPRELFIHGRTNFNKDEIAGFRDAAPEGTRVSGIQIRRPNDLKLFREQGRRGIMRGLALKVDDRNGFLWSSGYVPKLRTYPGREIPTPLKVKIVFGDTPLEQVLADIVALTKLNFNTCIYGDGYPVTLRFADDVGEILTAIPEVESKPLPFRHYI